MLPSSLRFTFQLHGLRALSIATLALVLAGSACGGSRPGDWTLPSAGGLTLGGRAALPAAGAGYTREGKQ